MSSISLPNNWSPRYYQMPAWRYLHSGGRRCELVWHRRAGKDELCLHWTACAAFERIANYWHMLPEYKQARKAIWDAVNPHTGRRRIDEAFPKEIRHKTKENEMHITFLNGSSWQVVGSDAYDSLVGSAPAGIVYSEWALSNPNVVSYLEPIVEENKGWQLFITTPRGRNHAYNSLMQAKAQDGAFAQVLTAEQTDVFSAQQLEEIKSKYIGRFGDEYGLSRYEQEYLCSFDAASIGAILARQIGLLEQNGRISSDVIYDSFGAGIEISADIGRRDTSSWWYWQPKVGGYSIVDYDEGYGLNAEEWAAKIKGRLGSRKLAKIWLPHDARAKTFAAKESAVEVFIREFGYQKVAITPDSKKSDRINAARSMIQKVEFSDKCIKGLEGLRAWSFEYNEENKAFSNEPKHDWASHPGDAFSYGCIVMQMTKEPEKQDFEIKGLQVGGQSNVTLNELWKDGRRGY